jgi:hypothetical protein
MLELPERNELIGPGLRGRGPATGRRERRMVGARGIEPAVDRLKAGCSAIELYPRWCAAPDSNRETLGFEPSDFTNLPSRASDPARNRACICTFGECRLNPLGHGTVARFPVIETGPPGLEDPAASQREGLGAPGGTRTPDLLVRSQAL